MPLCSASPSAAAPGSPVLNVDRICFCCAVSVSRRVREADVVAIVPDFPCGHTAIESAGDRVFRRRCGDKVLRMRCREFLNSRWCGRPVQNKVLRMLEWCGPKEIVDLLSLVFDLEPLCTPILRIRILSAAHSGTLPCFRKWDRRSSADGSRRGRLVRHCSWDRDGSPR